jgi:carbon-monoxide dehydrogenase large subunit
MPALGVDQRERLVGGRGRYIADIERAPDVFEAAFVRSPFPHARFTIGGAGGAVLGAADLELNQLRIEGPGLSAPAWAPIPLDTARYVGEPVAIALATDRYAAEDVAESVEISWEELELESPQTIFEARFSNGDVDGGFEGSARVVERRFTSARIGAVPLECRGVLARPLEGGRLELWTSTQIPHLVRRDVAAAMGVEPEAIRVLVPDVGGGFGLKAHVFAEEIAVAQAARRLGRPVRWIEDRRENLIAGSHAHDTEVELRVAIDREGRILGVDAEVRADVGAYSIRPFSASLEPMTCATTLFGPYAVPALRFHAIAFTTHKCPVGAHRGVGMDAAVYATERLIDDVAAELGLDPFEIRRRNLHRSLPVTSVTNRALDSGDYEGLLDELAQRGDYPALRRRQQAEREAGRLFGIGVALFNEHSGTGSTDYRRRGVTGIPGVDAARIVVDAAGRVIIHTSAADAGQAHAESYRELAVRQLGVRPEDVTVIEGDTDLAPFGSGTFASRGAVGVTEAVVQCLQEVAAADLAPGTDVVRTVDPSQVFPAGAHLAAVSVDPLTFRARVEAYTAAEDVGRVIFAAAAEAQVEGGVAMGIGDVLLEEHVYTHDGQIQTSTLLDYLVPLASDVPAITLAHLESPSPHTALGSKGIGEAGTVGAYGAVANAVADAVRPLGIDLTALPYSPGRIFEAQKGARHSQQPALEAEDAEHAPENRHSAQG